MRRLVAVGTTAIVLCLAAAGCGGATKTVTTTVPARTVTSSTTTPAPVPDDVLAIPTVGSFHGRCPRGAPIWTLRFTAPADGASDAIISKLGGGPVKHASLDPGDSLTFRLVPNSVHAHEPADQVNKLSATTVATTTPLEVEISQGTEPQYLVLDVHLALAAVGGESGQCALVDSSVAAREYPNSAP